MKPLSKGEMRQVCATKTRKYRTFGLKAREQIRKLVPVVPTQEVNSHLVKATVDNVSPVMNSHYTARRTYRNWCIVTSEIYVGGSGHPIEAIAGNIRRRKQVPFGAASVEILLAPTVVDASMNRSVRLAKSLTTMRHRSTTNRIRVWKGRQWQSSSSCRLKRGRSRASPSNRG